MELPGLIHANLARKPDLFWRVFYVLGLTLGLLVSTVVALTPIVLLVLYPSVWLLIPLVVVPLGVWLTVRLIAAGRKLFVRFTHLPEFRLYEDRIESVEWPNPLTKGVRFTRTTAATRRSINLGAVTSVVASHCIVRQTLTKYGGLVTETAPILYLRYRTDGQEELLSVPFPTHQDPGVNVWLQHLTDRGLPLQYTPQALYRHDTQMLDDAGRLQFLDGATNLVPYRYAAGWQTDEPELRGRWTAAKEVERDAEEARDPALKLARERHSVRKWITQMFVFIWLALTVFLQQLAVSGGGSAELVNLLLSAGALLLFGLVFFFALRSYLRWPYMFIYSGGALLTGLLMILASVDLSAAEQDVAGVFFFAALGFQPLCWVPYLIVRKFRGRLKSPSPAL